MNQRLEQLRKMHAADPADPFCTYGIALEIAKTDQIDEALSWLDKTLQLDPHYCYAYFQKGKILADDDRLDEAKAVLTDAIAKARAIPNDPDAAHAAEEMTALLDSLD